MGLTILYLAIVMMAMTVLSLFKKKAWKSRGYDARPIAWNWVIASSAVLGFGLGFVSWLGSENAILAASVSVAGYLTLFASVTDIMLLKIPSEPTYMAQIMGAIMFIASFPVLIPENFITLIFWAFMILVLGFASFLGYMGSADLKILVAFFLLFGWWLPPTLVIVAMFIMCALGFITSGLAKIFNLGVEKNRLQTTKWNPETQRNEAVGDLVEDDEQEKPSNGKSKKKTFFPFGPSILLAFTGIAVYTSYSSILVMPSL